MDIIFQSESNKEEEFVFENEVLVNKGIVTIFELPNLGL